MATSFERLELSRQTTVEQDPVNQLGSPMTLSPTSVRTRTVTMNTDIVGEGLRTRTGTINTDIIEEGKEEHEQQLNEFMMLPEKDAAEDTDEKTEKAEEKREESLSPVHYKLSNPPSIEAEELG